MMSPTLRTVPYGNLALVQQAILFDADVDKGAEIHHVADGAFELHTCHEVFGFEHIGAQDGSGGIVARVTSRADELFEDVFQRRHAAVPIQRQVFERSFGGQRVQGGDSVWDGEAGVSPARSRTALAIAIGFRMDG